jgi:CheY-like chemotaxis protein
MRVVLVSWAPDPAAVVEHLRRLADEVDVVAPKGPPDLKALADDPPAAVVIDLDRRPSDGLVIGIQLRRQPRTRHTPQVFAGGEPDKVERVRSILHDAHYSDWGGIATQLRNAIERPPEDPVIPDTMAPYAGVTLEQKLGLTGAGTVQLIQAPPEFADNVEEAKRTDGPADLVIFFARTVDDLENELAAALAAVAEGGSVWIAWPKGGKGTRGDVTQLEVRERGMAAGWVDYKVASLDDTWSALRFKYRG